MSEQQDGGPAFPLANTGYVSRQPGMTLRDYFAAAALQRLIGSADAENVAWEAYRYADAMLRARRQA